MRIITRDDLIDTYSKIVQRGSKFFFSKLNFNAKSRTKSAFSESVIYSSNWYLIPYVRQRWNKLITGNPAVNYKQHLVNKYLKDKTALKLLSLGSGTCSHELELAKYPQFHEIVCVDIAQNRLDEAAAIAKKENKNHMRFLCMDIKNYTFPEEYFDLVLFSDALHHFENVPLLLKNHIHKCLKKEGMLVINEFVGPKRLQFPKKQIQAINEALELIDKPYRKRYKTQLLKKKYYGSGIVRMIIADPSECVDSMSILPAIHNNFKTIEEKSFGGNLLMSALKDIAHHFVELDAKKKNILDNLFKLEDEYIKDNPSDFVFGIYERLK